MENKLEFKIAGKSLWLDVKEFVLNQAFANGEFIHCKTEFECKQKSIEILEANGFTHTVDQVSVN